MCDLDLNPTSTHLEEENQSRGRYGGHQPKNVGDLTKASNVENIMYLTTLDQLLEVLRKQVEATNATNVALAFAACPSRLDRAR